MTTDKDGGQQQETPALTYYGKVRRTVETWVDDWAVTLNELSVDSDCVADLVHRMTGIGSASATEDALRELREMFPELQIIVSVRDCGEEGVTLRETTLEYGVQIGMNGEEFDGDTMAEVLAQVRARHPKGLREIGIR